MGHKDHHEKASDPVNIFVVTVSDTRTDETDGSGDLIIRLLEGGGHTVSARRIVHDEPSEIKSIMSKLPAGVQAVIFNGGTGISKRDTTFDVIEPLLDKVLPGFGEIFRQLSYEEIGPAAIMSRAIAGVCDGRVIISIPGSTGAVKLALEKLVIPEISHMVWEMSR